MTNPSRTLGDFVYFSYGKALPARRRRKGDVSVYGSAGVIDSHDEALVTGPGIVVGRKGTIGAVYWSDGDFFPIDTTYFVVPKSKDVLLQYVYYLLQTLPLAQMNTDAAVPGLNRTNALGLDVLIPARHQQQRTIDILSAYDDLIENNRRRIALLAAAARLLYREWFVHFRFPGHEHVAVRDGVPEGWEKIVLADLCTVRRGASPRPIKSYMGGSVPWFKIGDATASESPFVFTTRDMLVEEGVAKSVLLPADELILSNSATCGVPYFTGVSGCVHDGWLYFRDLTRVNQCFLYCYLYARQREILQGIGEGATQKNLNTTYIGRQVLLLPRNLDLLDRFDLHVESLFAQMAVLAKTNLELRKARDLLLPRLMDGEIEI